MANAGRKECPRSEEEELHRTSQKMKPDRNETLVIQVSQLPKLE
jgi:alpha-D-ribose 1-methylphosphonate 5-triphosphate synthase subunit PhnH